MLFDFFAWRRKHSKAWFLSNDILRAKVINKACDATTKSHLMCLRSRQTINLWPRSHSYYLYIRLQQRIDSHLKKINYAKTTASLRQTISRWLWLKHTIYFQYWQVLRTCSRPTGTWKLYLGNLCSLCLTEGHRRETTITAATISKSQDNCCHSSYIYIAYIKQLTAWLGGKVILDSQLTGMLGHRQMNTWWVLWPILLATFIFPGSFSWYLI